LFLFRYPAMFDSGQGHHASPSGYAWRSRVHRIPHHVS
jgi:hypothetical protein